MKNQFKVFVFVLGVAVLTACSSEMSPMMKEAQSMSTSVMTMKDSLSTALDGKIAAVKTKLEAADTADSASIPVWNSALTSLGDIQAQLTAWASNVKTIPSVEELAKGTVNPFEGMTDDKVLEEVKGYMTEIAGVKSKIDAITVE